MTYILHKSASLKLINKRIIIKQLIISLQILLISILFSQFNLSFAKNITSNFEHYNTGFPLDGAHRKLRCNTCHKRGIFKGTPRTCAGCHSSRSAISSSQKSTRHILSTGSCDNCHVDKSWSITRMDHNAILGSCKTCHNGRVKGARAKTPNHVQSSDQCENCHTTRRWIPARFFHSDVTGNCIKCHNNPTAARTRGKNVGHIQSSNICSDCHRSFKTWKGGKIDHSRLTGGCNACHNGSTALGKNRGHFITTAQCDICHKSTVNFRTNLRYSHAGVFPSNHSQFRCIRCHTTNTQNDVGRNPGKNLIPTCGGCHGRRYNNKLGDHRNAPLASNTDCTGACHKRAGEHSTRSF